MATTRDPVGLALASLGAGACTGASLITAGMILLRSVQGDQPGGDMDTGFTIMSTALLAGLGSAAFVGIRLTRALGETWRRGAVGAISLFGSALLAGIAAPADMLGGRIGLVAYLVVLVVVAAVATRAARRAAVT